MEINMIKIGSLFSGIGGFELGLERAIPNSQTIWHVEQNKYCQRILTKHWPEAKIYDDVSEVGKHNLENVDIICGGFPCQNISTAGNKEGIYGKKSSLWWQMQRIIGELRPRVAVLENVPNLITLGLSEVLGSLAKIGYDAEWTVISAEQFGACHRRRRIFIVAYPGQTTDSNKNGCRQTHDRWIGETSDLSRGSEGIQQGRQKTTPNTYRKYSQSEWETVRLESKNKTTDNPFYGSGHAYWTKTPAPPPICNMDDGIPFRLAKLRALGNAIVPQCSEWIGQRIWQSGLLLDQQ